MPRLPALTPTTATGKARELLADLVDRHGTVGAMVRTMAHSPAVLGGYLELSRATKRSKLDRHITERISLAVQDRLDCALCLESHTAAARSLGISESEIAAARAATSSDPAIAEMLAFARRLQTAPASVTDEHLAALRRHGYSDREITDVVAVLALNVLTGTFNLLAGLEPEPA